MYDKPLTFMVGSINQHGSIFYHMDLLPWINYIYFNNIGYV